MSQQHIIAECMHSLLLWIRLHFPWLLGQKRFLRGLFIIVDHEMKRAEAAERGRWLHAVKRHSWLCIGSNDQQGIRKSVSAWLLSWPSLLDRAQFQEELTQLACAMIEQSVEQAVRRRDEGYKSAVREAAQEERRRWLRRINRPSRQ